MRTAATATGGVPRYRAWDGPPLLRHGFRPFFLGAGVWAVVALGLWLAALEGRLTLPTAFGATAWHAHEMIFGFAGAALAGFLLTAVPNWTGRMPLQGPPLAGLVALWLAGRAAVGLSAVLGALPAAAVDLALPAVLLAVVLREILTGRNWRNLPVCAALLGVLLANALTHLEAIGLAATGAAGLRLGTATLVLMIGLIGGRIVPSFTGNWLKRRGEAKLPASFGRFDRATLLVTLIALSAWVVAPEAPAVVGAPALAAGLLQAVRAARWRGHRTLAEPLVWVLHLGYAWVPVGLVLIGVGALWPALVPATAALHALTTGAIGTMILAVMTRATLGHTGRALTAGIGTTTIYALVTLAALARVAAPLLPTVHPTLLAISGLAWLAAFGLFAAVYGPMLAGARADGRPG